MHQSDFPKTIIYIGLSADTPFKQSTCSSTNIKSTNEPLPLKHCSVFFFYPEVTMSILYGSNQLLLLSPLHLKDRHVSVFNVTSASIISGTQCELFVQ